MTEQLDPLEADLAVTLPHFPPAPRGLQTGAILFRRYRLERILGRGGMGVVWLARDTKLDRPAALKFLPDVLCMDAASHDELKRETRRSLELTHPNIVRIHDFLEDEETAAISMEYVDGATLAQLRIRRESRVFDARELAPWIASLCAALDYAHHHACVVHRDLKPSNLMLTTDGVLKVADFGIACGLQNTIARVTVMSSSGGTLGYMSPQQMQGELAAVSDDIYSLGATLYELLTSKPPFYSGDIGFQLREVVPERMTERRLKLGVGGAPIPPVWENVIASCLAKNPAARPRSAAEVARALGLENVRADTQFARPEISVPVAIAPAPLPRSAQIAQVLAGLPRPNLAFTTAAAASLLAIAIIAWPRSESASAHPVAPPPASETAIVSASPSSPALVAEAAKASAPVLVTAPQTESAAPKVPALPTNPDAALLTQNPPSSAPPSVTKPLAGQLEIRTTPPGLTFRILSAAIDSPQTETIRSGITPATFDDLPPGTYQVALRVPGGAERAWTVQLRESGVTGFEQAFSAAPVTLQSTPSGAEIYEVDQLLGTTPCDVLLTPGRHILTAKLGDRPARSRTILVKEDVEQTLKIDFASGSNASSSGSHRARRTPKEEDSAITKVGRTLSKFFGGDSKPKPNGR